MLAKLPCQVHFDEGRGIALVIREGDLAQVRAALAQVVRGQLGLGALAGAIQTFKNDEFTHSGVPPF